MDDKKTPTGTPQPDTLLGLVAELRAKAQEHGDADAIHAAERAHEYVRSGNHEKARFHLASLQTVAALTPVVNAISNALAGIGA
jgi:hypothetical protein